MFEIKKKFVHQVGDKKVNCKVLKTRTKEVMRGVHTLLAPSGTMVME
jgi:hypothetical protein